MGPLPDTEASLRLCSSSGGCPWRGLFPENESLTQSHPPLASGWGLTSAPGCTNQVAPQEFGLWVRDRGDPGATECWEVTQGTFLSSPGGQLWRSGPSLPVLALKHLPSSGPLHTLPVKSSAEIDPKVGFSACDQRPLNLPPATLPGWRKAIPTRFLCVRSPGSLHSPGHAGVLCFHKAGR